jgi:hypothetical protein
MLWLDLPNRPLSLRVGHEDGWFYDGWELEKAINEHVPVAHTRLDARGGLRGWFLRYGLALVVAPLATFSVIANPDSVLPAGLGVAALLLLMFLLAREDLRRS